MIEKVKTVILTEEQINREISRIQNLIKMYKKTDKEEVLMYLKGKLETLNWIKEVQLNAKIKRIIQ